MDDGLRCSLEHSSHALLCKCKVPPALSNAIRAIGLLVYCDRRAARQPATGEGGSTTSFFRTVASIVAVDNVH